MPPKTKRQEHLEASLRAEKTRIDIKRMKKVNEFLSKAHDVISAGDFHLAENQALMGNVAELIADTDSRIAEVLNKAD